MQRDDGKGMEGEAGYLTGINNETLRPMIEITKGVETGYGSILAISDMESAMRDERIKKRKPSARIAASAAALMSGQRAETF